MITANIAELTVLATGPLATVQDRGRRGWARLGVGHSGAADQVSHDLANRLVGNFADAATIECTFGGLSVRIGAACVLATAGAPCAIAVRDGPPMAHQQPVALPAGATVTLAAPTSGLRTYLAVRGGIAVAPVMGSRSTDILSGVGPPVLQPATIVPIGSDPGTELPTVAAPWRPPSEGPLEIWPGPRRHWFTDSSAATLANSSYAVHSASNRIGVRLAGPALHRSVHGQLPSEGLVEGAIQVPADGQPVVFLADHGTTGGYPVIGVVDPADLPRLAQARPGDTIRFRWATSR